MAYIAYIKNRQRTAALPPNQTPYTLRYKRTPDFRQFHRFGCAAWLHTPKNKRNKLEPHAERGIFVGYSDNQKAFRVYRPKKCDCYSSIHVDFDDQTHGIPNVQVEGEYDYDSLLKTLHRR